MTATKQQLDDFKRFSTKLQKAFTLADKPLEPHLIALYWETLHTVPIDKLLMAVETHIRDPQRGHFAPKPSDILRFIPSDPHTADLPADEAWAIALGAADEKNTVVWTVSIQGAWFACLPIYALGDAIGARMAFRSAYERLVTDATIAGFRPHWVISLGWDREQSEQVLRHAALLGRISPDLVAGYLPELKPSESTALVDRVAKRLTRARVTASRVTASRVTA